MSTSGKEADAIRDYESEIAQLRHDLEKALANHTADLNSAPSSTAPSELEQKLDAIAKALGYPVECWRMAGCDVMAHAIGDLIANYGRLQEQFYKIDATLDELGAPADGEWEGIKTKLSRRGRIKALLSATRVESAWVPVSERLPEHSGYYHVWTDGPHDPLRRNGTATAYFYTTGTPGWRLLTGDGEITHWMPLPKSPEPAPASTSANERPSKERS